MEGTKEVKLVELKKKDIAKGGLKLIGGHCVSKVVTEMLRNTTGWGNIGFMHKATLMIGTGIISWCVSDYCVEHIDKKWEETEAAIKEYKEVLIDERETGTEDEA